MNDDNNSSYDDDFPDDLTFVDLKDLTVIAVKIRMQSIIEFNHIYKGSDMCLGKKKILQSPSRMSQRTMEKIITLDEVKEIMTEVLPYNHKADTFQCNVHLFWDCVQKATRKIFYNIFNTLTNVGIYQMCWDPSTNDFVWKLTPKYQEIFDKNGKIEVDINNLEEPDNLD